MPNQDGYAEVVDRIVQLVGAVKEDGRVNGPNSFAVLCSLLNRGISFEKINDANRAAAEVITAIGVENL
jgi:hypothetical protein